MTAGAPERRVVLHVGTMKSGTTSIQSLLFAHRQAIADQGVLALGERWADQVSGVTALIADPEAPGEPWRRLVDQARAWEGTSVISMEFLGPFIPRRVRAAVESFGDLPVQVVITLRDLNRTIPSLWQEAIQNGRSWPWPDYRSGARDARPWQATRPATVTEPGRTFWRQQDAHRIARRWAEAVGPEQVCVVTLPPPGAPRSTLVERFSRVVGFSVDHLAVVDPQNAALGAASAQTLQRVNARLAEWGMAEREAASLRKRLLAKQVLAARRGEEEAIGLEVEPWVVEASARMVELLREAGVRLEGDWADLTPVPARGVDPTGTPEHEIVAAARFGFEGLRTRLEEDGGASLPRWPDPGDAAGAVEALAGLVRTAAASGRG